MADLDSFFAKKDKKKVKGKKFTTTDEIAKRLEDSEKKLEKEYTKVIETPKKVEETGTIEETETAEAPPKKKPQPVKEQQSQKKEEEEWNDFVDESSRDYSDLKITKLQIEDEEEGGGSGEDDNENSDKDEKKDGVWKKEAQQTQQVTGPAPEPDEKEPTPVPANTASSYVPPHLRNSGGGPTPSRPTSRRKCQAPDITNEMAFPSLSDAQAANPMGAWGKKKSSDDRGGFENVKHGSTRTSHEGFAGPRLSVTNRFDALSDNS